MVATQEARATQIGLEVLKKGGNAVDAAVAVGFALAVTLPRAGNIGGGGFMLIHMAKTGKTVALDYREKAPEAATHDMYINPLGRVVKMLSRSSYQSVGVPGSVAGLAAALEKYGTLPLSDLIAPAIQLAEEGMVVNDDHVATLTKGRTRLQFWPETAKIFYKPDGSVFERGEILVQKDLAGSLRQIAEQGPRVFYEGAISEKIVADMEANGGLITRKDLKDYDVVFREPVRGSYRGYEIVAMPPPSSGGIHVIQLLNTLEPYPIQNLGHNSADTIHLMAEAMKLAFADRSKHLGDSDYWQVPIMGLTSKAYATQLRNSIDPNRARPASEIGPGNPIPYESNETTHFSIIDKEGNTVSNTTTINFSFGTGIVAKGTGILLNNEMENFTAKVGVPNAYGLLGGYANVIHLRKRPLSSMSPMLVLKKGKPFLATGSPGGPRIIPTMLQIIMNVIDHRMNIAEATNARRFHHQWKPDELRIEKGFNQDTLRLLKKKGHHLIEKNAIGSTQSVMRTDDGLFGASDPRRMGALTLGY
ncbi:MAG: gamma-glutamyltransferase [Nitrospinaceae bacterium]|nr:MAG: gamma-glutamyltransferase [Nitrospinaceae bacterium]